MSAQRFYLDAGMLVRREACASQVRAFRHTFGDGPVEITAENIRKARLATLDIRWVAFRLGLSDGEGVPRQIKAKAIAIYDRLLETESRSECDAETLALVRQAAKLWAAFKKQEAK